MLEFLFFKKTLFKETLQQLTFFAIPLNGDKYFSALMLAHPLCNN